MFNEAFWFFYLIGMVGSLTTISSIIAFTAGLAGGFGTFFSFLEEDKQAMKISFRVLTVSAVFTCIVILVPTQQSLYAGGAQYAVQAVELDDTIMAFKDIIDAKIADLTPTEGETE